MNEKNQELTAAQLTPKTIQEALKLMAAGFVPVAGGTDLMVRRHALKKSSDYKLELPGIFSCLNLTDTDFINLDNGRFSMSSAAKLADIISHQHCPPVLRESLLSIASPGIRNIATLAGNICNASPAADSLPALYVLNAEIESAAMDAQGAVVMSKTPIQDFIKGPGQTITGSSGFVKSVSCDSAEELQWGFRKVGTRAANALSKLNIAAVYDITDGVFGDFRLAVGACAPTIIRSRQAEKLIVGSSINDSDSWISAVMEIYSSLITPIDDQRSTAEYRKNTALKLIKDIILHPGE